MSCDSSNSRWRYLASEPFRLFFVLGWLAGIAAALVWPLHYYDWGVSDYPGLAHARLMIEGFTGAFIIGFLGTAGPRLMRAFPLTLVEVLILASLHVCVVGLHLSGKIAYGDSVFLLLILLLAKMLGVRLVFRQDIPPPGFVLVGLAFVSCSTGIIMWLVGGINPLGPFAYRLASLLVYQGFTLLPLAGVGAFFFPRFFGLESRHDFPVNPHPTYEWKREAVLYTMGGLAVIGSFAMEAAGGIVVGLVLRASVLGALFLRGVPLHRAKRPFGTLGWCAVIGLVCVPAGLLAMTVGGPAGRVANQHIFFLGGLGLLILAVATRVVLGHSGNAALIRTRMGPIIIMLVLLGLALVSRVSADYLPAMRASHHIYAAWLWIGMVLIWGAYVLRHVITPDDS